MFKTKKTYETITAGLRQLVDELLAHGDEHVAKANHHDQQAELHTAKAAEAMGEADRAHKTAQKIGALLDD